MNIPTAEEFLKLGVPKAYYNEVMDYLVESDILSKLQEFAKLHVQAALKAASKAAEPTSSNYTCSIIRQAYPLNNIQ